MDSSRFHILCQDGFLGFEQNDENGENFLGKREKEKLGQHRTIPALRLKHCSGICRTSLAVSVLRIMRYCPIFLMAAISTDTE